MSKKVSDPREGVYILKKKKSLGDIKGITGKPRLMLKGTDDEGRELIEDHGEYHGYKFPSSVEDVVPCFDPVLRKWAFDGDEELLQDLVKKIKLRYPRSHPEVGKIIQEASVRDPEDAFFDHPSWTEKPAVMEGSSLVMNVKDDPRMMFLMLVSVGNRFIEDGTSDNPITAAGMQYKILKSSASNEDQVKSAMTELELMGALNDMSTEKAKEISIILGLIFSLDAEYNTDLVKPNLVESIKKTSANPGEKRVFENKSYRSFFAELIKDKPATISKKVNVRLAINKNILRFKDGSYNINGKVLPGLTGFTGLVDYFSTKEAAEDYGTLIEALEA